MQGLIITCVLILGLVLSPCLCGRLNIIDASNTYNVMNYGARGDGRSDDSHAFLSAWKIACGAQQTATLVIPPNKLFLVTNVLLNGPCKATSIYILLQGKIIAPSKNAWKDKSYWIEISYVNGLTIYGGGILDGYGSTWWQSCGKGCQRPTALWFHGCNRLTVSYINVNNAPGSHIIIDGCNGATFSHININAPALSPNTDGFDIAASKNILIQKSYLRTGDDCIAIIGGCSIINVSEITCGPGHGISIGSLGRQNMYDTVEEVYVRNCTFIGTENGARIKTYQGGSGYARKITYEQIILKGAQRPIVIDQNYINTGYPTKNGAVQVSGVTFRGFRGTSADDRAIILDCSYLGCFNIVLDQIDIVSSQPGKPATASCKNAHGTATSVIPNVSCLLR